MMKDIERVYNNSKARKELGWEPKHSFGSLLDLVEAAPNDPDERLMETVLQSEFLHVSYQ